MNVRFRFVVWIAVSSLVLIGGCAAPEGEAPSAPKEGTGGLNVYAVNYPLAYFAERLGGDDVEVVLPVPAGEDPAFWAPGPEPAVTQY